MPVVSTGTIGLKGEDGKFVQFKQVIKYSVSLEKFSIQLPKFTHEILGYDSIVGETLAKVKFHFSEVMEEFYERCTSKQKIIAFDFKCNASKFVRTDGTIQYGIGEVAFGSVSKDSRIEKCLFRKQEVSFTGGIAMDFWYKVGYRTTSSFDKFANFVSLDGYSFDSDTHCSKVKYMLWTPEREAFFTAFTSQSVDLFIRMYDFLNQDVSEVAKLLDQNITPLSLPIFKPKGDLSQ